LKPEIKKYLALVEKKFRNNPNRFKDEIGSKPCQQSCATGRNDCDDPRLNLPDCQENKPGPGKTKIAGP
jgi:hypothetical protein